MQTSASSYSQYILCANLCSYILCISVDEASKFSHLFREIYDNIPDDSRNNNVAVELIITLWRF